MSQMSLNTTTLGNLFKGQQPSDNTGWNWDGGQSAYFVSQASEYSISKPTTASATGVASDDLRQAALTFGQTAAKLLAQSSDPTIVQKGQDIEAWGNGVYDDGSVEQLTASYTLTHIRNNQVDDTADVSVTFLYCDPIGCPIPMVCSTSIQWAKAAEKIDKAISVFGGMYYAATPPSMNDGATITAKVLELLDIEAVGTCLQIWALSWYAMDIADTVVGALINLANDGGRVNFLAVMAHAMQRVAVSTEPAPPARGSYITLDADAMPCGWIKGSLSPSISPMSSVPYEEGAFYGSYPSQDAWNGSQMDYDDTTAYRVGMPDLSWGVGGLTVLATAKVNYDGSDMYTVVLTLFGLDGGILAETVVIQSDVSSDSIVAPNPSWTLDDNPSSLTSVIHGELQSIGVLAGETTTIQLQYMIPQLVGAWATPW